MIEGTELNPGLHSKQGKLETIIATWEIMNAKSKPYGCFFSFFCTYKRRFSLWVCLGWRPFPIYLNMTSYAWRDMNVFRLKTTFVCSELSDRFEYIWNLRQKCHKAAVINDLNWVLRAAPSWKGKYWLQF